VGGREPAAESGGAHATAYALLERNLEVGPECIERLQKAGAPKPSEVEAGFKARVRERLPETMTHSEAGKKGGRGNKAGSITPSFSDRGATRALRRLKRDRPDLAEQVIAGKLSAHAAAIKAGFRGATWSAPVDPEQLAVSISKRYPEWVMVRREDR
jgi:hypothetical protein